MTLTMVETPEIEFNSMDEFISEIKLVFQVPSGRVNFNGQTRVTLDSFVEVGE